MAWSIVLRDGSPPIFNNTSKNNQKMADKLSAILRSNRLGLAAPFKQLIQKTRQLERRHRDFFVLHFGAESAFIFYAAK